MHFLAHFILVVGILASNVPAHASDDDWRARDRARETARYSTCVRAFTGEDVIKAALASEVLKNSELEFACGFYSRTYDDSLDCAIKYATRRGGYFLQVPEIGFKLCAAVGFQAKADACEAGLVAGHYGVDLALNTCRSLDPALRSCMEHLASHTEIASVATAHSLCRSFGPTFRTCILKYTDRLAPFDRARLGATATWTFADAANYCESLEHAARPCVTEVAKGELLNADCIVRGIYEQGCAATLQGYSITRSLGEKICALKNVEMQTCAIRTSLRYLAASKKTSADNGNTSGLAATVSGYTNLIELLSTVGMNRAALQNWLDSRTSGIATGRAELSFEDRVLLTCMLQTQNSGFKLPAEFGCK